MQLHLWLRPRYGRPHEYLLRAGMSHFHIQVPSRTQDLSPTPRISDRRAPRSRNNASAWRTWSAGSPSSPATTGCTSCVRASSVTVTRRLMSSPSSARRSPRSLHLVTRFELHQQVTGSLGGPRTGRVCGHPEQISPAGTMRNSDQRRESRHRRSFVAVYGQDLVAAVTGGASLAEGVDQPRRVSTQDPGSSSLRKVLQNYSLD